MKNCVEPWKDPEVRAVFFNRHENLPTIAKNYFSETPFVSLKQVHSATVKLVSKFPPNFHSILGEGDALVTSLRGVALVVHTADCLPLLAYGKNSVGACHGGWRGLSLGIIPNWIETFVSLGEKVQDLRVSLGPAIQKCHFEVRRDVAEKLYQFKGKRVSEQLVQQMTQKHSDPQKVFIDLTRLAVHHLIASGVSQENISGFHLCTFCDEKSYHSYRRDGAQQGRMESVILRSI